MFTRNFRFCINVSKVYIMRLWHFKPFGACVYRKKYWKNVLKHWKQPLMVQKVIVFINGSLFKESPNFCIIALKVNVHLLSCSSCICFRYFIISLHFIRKLMHHRKSACFFSFRFYTIGVAILFLTVRFLWQIRTSHSPKSSTNHRQRIEWGRLDRSGYFWSGNWRAATWSWSNGDCGSRSCLHWRIWQSRLTLLFHFSCKW